jgi:hypothetical protein
VTTVVPVVGDVCTVVVTSVTVGLVVLTDTVVGPWVCQIFKGTTAPTTPTELTTTRATTTTKTTTAHEESTTVSVSSTSPTVTEVTT